ncbi:MAG: hypothetical protein WBQ64_09060 [Terriglobales bacterium]
MYRKDVLAYAYDRCQANGGAAGVDNQTFENIEAHGRERIPARRHPVLVSSHEG